MLSSRCDDEAFDGNVMTLLSLEGRTRRAVIIIVRSIHQFRVLGSRKVVCLGSQVDRCAAKAIFQHERETNRQVLVTCRKSIGE